REALADPEIGAVFPADAAVSDLVVAGVNTDQRAEQSLSLDEIVEAYLEQLRATEATGAGAVLMASRHLARTATSAEEFEDVYRRVLEQATAPVILHWLGTVFDPQLGGYFGSDDPAAAADVLLRIIEADPAKIRGVEMILLADAAGVAGRERLPAGVRMLTGDDFHFSHLSVGDGTATAEPGAEQVRGEYSDALLGAFAATAPAASAAVQALDAGDPEEARRILDASEVLGRHVFSAPTFHYKTGVAFLAWLNGHQQAFTMVGGMHAARSLPHLSRTIELAATTGNLEDPQLAAERWHAMLRLAGFDAPEGSTRCLRRPLRPAPPRPPRRPARPPPPCRRTALPACPSTAGPAAPHRSRSSSRPPQRTASSPSACGARTSRRSGSMPCAAAPTTPDRE